MIRLPGPSLEAAGGRLQAVGTLIEKFDIMFALPTPNYSPTCVTVCGHRTPWPIAGRSRTRRHARERRDRQKWVPFSNYGQGNLDGTRNLTHPLQSLPCLTAATRRRRDGSFPTTLLQHGRIAPGANVSFSCSGSVATPPALLAA